MPPAYSLWGRPQVHIPGWAQRWLSYLYCTIFCYQNNGFVVFFPAQGFKQSDFSLEASFRRHAQKPLQWPLSRHLGKKDNGGPQLFIFVKKQNIILCVAGYFACMCVCAHIAQRGQKRAMDLWEWQLEMVVRHHVGAKNWTWILWKAVSALSLQSWGMECLSIQQCETLCDHFNLVSPRFPVRCLLWPCLPFFFISSG